MTKKEKKDIQMQLRVNNSNIKLCENIINQREIEINELRHKIRVMKKRISDLKSMHENCE